MGEDEVTACGIEDGGISIRFVGGVEDRSRLHEGASFGTDLDAPFL
jgi:hypothetical protein